MRVSTLRVGADTVLLGTRAAKNPSALAPRRAACGRDTHRGRTSPGRSPSRRPSCAGWAAGAAARAAGAAACAPPNASTAARSAAPRDASSRRSAASSDASGVLRGGGGASPEASAGIDQSRLCGFPGAYIGGRLPPTTLP